jgi:hypothetical protein
MRCNLYVKGLKEPIELEELEGKAAQALISDATKPNDTPFVIEGVWAGKKGEMKFVMFPKEDVRHYSGAIEPMAEVEAVEFEIEIAQDKKKSEEVFGHKGFASLFYYERQKAIRLEIIDIPDRGIKTFQIHVHDPALYMILEKQFEKYSSWKSKKEFGEKKRIEEFDKMSESVADSMKIE